ncbi:MAG: hypothetical protein L6R19_13610 [Alphaproteobacteria bacterium]|nr:hypothetical protein [Alphaproteobacteria bacterium]
MSVPAAARRRAGWLIALLLPGFVVAALGTGWLRQSVLHEPIIVAVDLRDAGLPVRQLSGRAYAVDLSRLSPSARGDRIAVDAGPEPLPVLHAVVVEDGAPLLPGRWPQEVIDQPGRFLLQGRMLYVSASDGSDPAGNGRRYGLALQVPRWSMRAGDLFQTYRAYFHPSNSMVPAILAMGTVLGLGAALAAALARFGATTGARCAVAAVAFLAAAAGLAVEQSAHWNDAIVGYDTESYMERPENSYRPPGYSLFARAVAAHVPPATLHSYPKERRVVGDQGDRVLRLVRAGKLFAYLSLLAFGLALCLLVPGTIAAALLLGLGNAASAVPAALDQPVYAVTVTGLAGIALVASVVYGARRRGEGRWLPAMLVSAAIAALAGSGMVLQYGVFADFYDWAMSETVAHALGLLTLAAVLGFAFAGRRWMLPAAALGAALVCLTRQAEPYYWVVVLGMLPVAFRRDGRAAWRPAAFVGVLLVLSTVGLHVGIAAASRAVQLGELHRAAFALFIADPADAGLMPDAATREFLDDAMAQRDTLIGAGHARPRKIANHFYGLSIDIAWPTALRVAQRHGAEDAEGEARAIMQRAAAVIFAQHYDRYLGFVAGSFGEIAGMMRVAHLVPWWLLAVAVGVAAATVRGMHAYLAVLLVAAALAGYAIIAVASGPIERLVYPLDTLWFLACVLLAVGAWQRWRAGRAAA